MIVIDTERVAPKERFSYWVDTIGADFFPIDAEELDHSETVFSGQIEASFIGDVTVTRHAATPYKLKRTSRSISRAEKNFVTVGIPHSSAPVIQSFGDNQLVARRGDVIVYDIDAEHDVWGPNSSSELSIFVPRDRLEKYLGRVPRFSPRYLTPSDPLTTMLRALGQSLYQTEAGDQRRDEGLSDVATHLVSVAYGLHPEADQTIGQSLADARVLQARLYIRSHCTDPRLNVQLVAHAIGISARRLYALFEREGTSVSMCILEARVSHAQGLLMRRPDFSVEEVASASGFYSLSTFYRAFADRFGISPARYRDAGLLQG
ncbi:MAG: AraC family transcriptional regulator [Hyphomicrobiaceae bacterium]|nr:AraC family transcriptional regulator [Hyphomicrobiaceae bacterium]